MITEKEIEHNTYELLIAPELISIKKNQIVEILGYNNFPEQFEKLLDDITKELKKKLQIKAGYKILDYKPTESKDGIIISDIFFKTDKIVKSQLNRIERVAVFVSTIGKEIENWIKELNKEGDILLSYLTDITASEAVENIADILHEHLKEKMKNQGLNVTNRYSPGYCNWSVYEQHKLFSLLPENFCEVKLTDSALMIPIKSISGIIGIGKYAKWKEYQCDKCGVKDCTYRIKIKTKKNNYPN